MEPTPASVHGEPGEAESRDLDNRDSGHDSDGTASGSEDEGRHVSFRARSPESEIASMVSRALVGDRQLGSASSASAAKLAASAPKKEKELTCSVCAAPALYTCPACGRRTCSMTCIRVHKADHHCTGVRDVAEKIPLSDFTDAQLQRDFRFLEDCRRVSANADRLLPHARRFNFKALPPPLRTLREAARRRGVVCQITSDGMVKRQSNTSRYDRLNNTIIWRCEFVFRKINGQSFTVATDWASERHHLGDVVRYCWAAHPTLPCHPINQSYNHPARYAGHQEDEAGEAAAGPQDAETQDADHITDQLCEGTHDREGDETDGDEDGDDKEAGGDGPEAQDAEAEENVAEVQEGSLHSEAEDVGEAEGQPAPDTPSSVAAVAVEVPPPRPSTPEEVRDESLVREFLGMEDGWVVLSRAERLGPDRKYFLMDPDQTLNENMRLLFFVNEFPVFDLVHTSELAGYPLVTDADKESIRASFRAKERTPEELLRRRYPGLKLKSEMDPEEADRLGKVPCRMNLMGRCAAGENCPYWHCTVEEWPQCRSFEKTQRCTMGYRCSFRHGNRLPGEEQPDGVNTGKRPREFGRGRGGRGGGRGGRGFGFGSGGGGRGFRGGRGGSYGPRM